jgi:hypothetical protein
MPCAKLGTRKASTDRVREASMELRTNLFILSSSYSCPTALAATLSSMRESSVAYITFDLKLMASLLLINKQPGRERTKIGPDFFQI